MKENINHIVQFKGNNKVTYHVYYTRAAKKRTFTEKDNMPNTVLLFMLNSRNTETKTTNTGTITRFY